LRRAAFALLTVRAAAKLGAAVVLVPAARLCAHTPIGGWDLAPPCVNRVCAPADMGGVKAGPVRDKSPHWSRPYLGPAAFRASRHRPKNDRIATIGMEPAVKVNVTAMVQVRAADQATARKVIPTVLGAPGTNDRARQSGQGCDGP